MVSEATERYKPMAAAYYLYVEDADASMQQALKHGAVLEMEVDEMPYGDRQGGVKDQHGNILVDLTTYRSQALHTVEK